MLLPFLTADGPQDEVPVVAGPRVDPKPTHGLSMRAVAEGRRDLPHDSELEAIPPALVAMERGALVPARRASSERDQPLACRRLRI